METGRSVVGLGLTADVGPNGLLRSEDFPGEVAGNALKGIFDDLLLVPVRLAHNERGLMPTLKVFPPKGKPLLALWRFQPLTPLGVAAEFLLVSKDDFVSDDAHYRHLSPASGGYPAGASAPLLRTFK